MLCEKHTEICDDNTCNQLHQALGEIAKHANMGLRNRDVAVVPVSKTNVVVRAFVGGVGTSWIMSNRSLGQTPSSVGIHTHDLMHLVIQMFTEINMATILSYGNSNKLNPHGEWGSNPFGLVPVTIVITEKRHIRV